MKTFLKALPVPLLILLYCYAALSKLLDTDAFREQLYNQTFPHVLADPLLYGLPLTELLTVALLVMPRTQFAGLLLSFSLLLLFSGYIALVLLGYWNRVPCSCGGILSRMSWQTHLLFNLAFLGINAFAISRPATLPVTVHD